jgi:hypothetical protein
VELADRIHFDSVARRLVFHGFMSRAMFERLDALHNDATYQRAIQQLFGICVYEEPASTSHRMLTVKRTGAVLAGMLVAVGAVVLLRIS